MSHSCQAQCHAPLLYSALPVAAAMDPRPRLDRNAPFGAGLSGNRTETSGLGGGGEIGGGGGSLVWRHSHTGKTVVKDELESLCLLTRSQG